jgi:hypothetical protein
MPFNMAISTITNCLPRSAVSRQSKQMEDIFQTTSDIVYNTQSHCVPIKLSLHRSTIHVSNDIQSTAHSHSNLYKASTGASLKIKPPQEHPSKLSLHRSIIRFPKPHHIIGSPAPAAWLCPIIASHRQHPDHIQSMSKTTRMTSSRHRDPPWRHSCRVYYGSKSNKFTAIHMAMHATHWAHIPSYNRMDVGHPCHIDNHNNTAIQRHASHASVWKTMLSFSTKGESNSLTDNALVFTFVRGRIYDSNVHNVSSKDSSSDLSCPFNLIQSCAHTMTIW